jgi:hypothetical protein
LWAFGIYNLHLSDKEFWHLTLAQFDALVSQYLQEQENLDFRAALVCAVLANIHRDPKKRQRPFEAKDFMPQRRSKKVKTEKQMKDDLVAANIALGGEVK